MHGPAEARRGPQLHPRGSRESDVDARAGGDRVLPARAARVVDELTDVDVLRVVLAVVCAFRRRERGFQGGGQPKTTVLILFRSFDASGATDRGPRGFLPY